MNTPIFSSGRRGRRAFSLVEALATVAIIGIITFIALPNIIKMRRDAERNTAIARAEALNLAIAAYVQAKGIDVAAREWELKNAAERYAALRPYLAFAPETLNQYVSHPYELDLQGYDIEVDKPLAKITLTEAVASVGEDEEGPPVSSKHTIAY